MRPRVARILPFALVLRRSKEALCCMSRLQSNSDREYIGKQVKNNPDALISECIPHCKKKIVRTYNVKQEPAE